MPRRLFDIDGGPGDNHQVLLDEDGKWHGWENLFTHLPRRERRDAIARLLHIAVHGRTGEYDIYTIRELPDGLVRTAAVPQPE